MSKARTWLVIALLVAGAPALAGCIEPPSDHPPAGDNAVAAPVATHAAITLKDVDVIITATHGSGAPVAMEWLSTGGRWEDQTFTLPMRYDGEHGTFNMTLAFRVDGAFPVHLAYNETLERRHSFTFTYEAAPADGARVDHVVTVDADASWLDAETWEPSRRDVSGRFHFEFEAACGACPGDEDEPVHVTVQGRFPKPKR